MRTSPRQRILSIDPFHQGFAFAVLETSPLLLIDWGMRDAKKNTNAVCRTKVRDLIDTYQPTILVLERPRGKGSYRRERVAKLIRNLATLGRARGVKVRFHSRADVRQAFRHEGVSSRYEIAMAISRLFPELMPWMPAMKEFYEDPDRRLEIFDAVALGVTHRAGFTPATNWQHP